MLWKVLGDSNKVYARGFRDLHYLESEDEKNDLDMNS
jgi:hypothetical protein